MDQVMTDTLYRPPKRMQLVGFVAAEEVKRHMYMKVGGASWLRHVTPPCRIAPSWWPTGGSLQQ